MNGTMWPGVGEYMDENGVVQQCKELLERCAGNNTCGELYADPPQCLMCADGAYRFETACKVCPELAEVYAIVGVFGMFALVAVLLKFARSGTFYMTSIGVALNFFQVMGIFSTLRVGWADNVDNLLTGMRVFNMDARLFPLDCYSGNGGYSYKDKWLIKILLPLFFIPVFVLTFAFRYLYLTIKIYCKQSSKTDKRLERKRFNEYGEEVVIADLGDTAVERVMRTRRHLKLIIINAALSFLVMVYVSVTLSAVEVFDCEEPDGGGVALQQLTFEPCYQSPGDEETLVTVGFLAMAVYGLGIPIVLIAVLVSNRRGLHLEQNVLKYGLIYRKYNAGPYMWELVIILRKLLTVLTKVVDTHDKYKLAVIAVILLLSSVAQLIVYPYQTTRVDRLEQVTLTALMAIAISGVVFYTNPDDPPDLQFWNNPKLGSSIIVIAFIIGTAACVFLVLYDIRHARRMRNHGLSGMFANEDVQVFPHFFKSGFTNRTEGNHVSTTDHYRNIIFRHKPPKNAGYMPELQTTIIDARDLGVGRIWQQHRKVDCLMNVQHDWHRHQYVINFLIFKEGKYLLRFSGGKEIKRKNANLKVWDQRRWLMEYNLAVTRPSQKNQTFVDMSVARQYGIVVYQPVERVLEAGKNYFFNISTYSGVAVKVLQAGREVILKRENKKEHVYVGDVEVQSEGDVVVLVSIPKAVLSGRSHSKFDATDIEEFEVLIYKSVKLGGQITDIADVAERAAPTLTLPENERHCPTCHYPLGNGTMAYCIGCGERLIDDSAPLVFDEDEVPMRDCPVFDAASDESPSRQSDPAVLPTEPPPPPAPAPAAPVAGAPPPAAPPAAATELPFGWIEQTDDRGQKFYVDVATGQSHWTLPASQPPPPPPPPAAAPPPPPAYAPPAN